jgi:hypothetical protein
MRAASAVRSCGTNCIPLLLSYLGQRDNRLLDYSREAWSKLTGATVNRDPLFLRAEAVLGFEALGEVAKTADPMLREMMLNDALAYDSARALGAIKNTNTMTFFLNCLSNARPEQRKAGAAGLGSLGSLAQPSVPAMVALTFVEKNEGVRASIVDALGRIGGEAVVPSLLERFQNDESLTVRICATAALRHFPAQTDLIERVLRSPSNDEGGRLNSIVSWTLKSLYEAQSTNENSIILQ